MWERVFVGEGMITKGATQECDSRCPRCISSCLGYRNYLSTEHNDRGNENIEFALLAATLLDSGLYNISILVAFFFISLTASCTG